MLQDLVKKGETRLAAGKGFYGWDGCDAAAVKQQASAQLAKLLDFLDKDLGTAEGTRTRARK